MIVIGETARETFNTFIPGEVFTRVSSRVNGVDTVFDPIFTDLLNGWYEWAYAPAVEGTYSWNGNGSISGPITINFEVEAAPIVLPTVPILPGTLGVGSSLAELIRAVAQRSQDLWDVQATVESGGTNTIQDELGLIEDDNYFEGMELYITSGDHAGTLHRVIGSDYDTGTITFKPDVSSPITIGTTAELYNRRGNGHRRWEYREAINNSIKEGGSNSGPRFAVNVPTTVSSTVPFFAIPAGFSDVCLVQYLGWDGTYRPIRRNKRHGWDVDRVQGIIVLYGSSLAVADGRSLLVSGYTNHSPLVNDTDTTGLDIEWIVESAAGILQNANPDNAGNLAPGQYLRNRADATRGKMVTVRDANCVKV